MLRTARALGVAFVLRNPDDPYNFSRRELVEALFSTALNYGLDTVKATDADTARFMGEMRRAVIENQGSHGDDNPFRWGSIGDDESFWEDFKKLRDYFTCKCGKLKLVLDALTNKPRCSACGLNFKMVPHAPPSPATQ